MTTIFMHNKYYGKLNGYDYYIDKHNYKFDCHLLCDGYVRFNNDPIIREYDNNIGEIESLCIKIGKKTDYIEIVRKKT